jgi:hypothetical protein
MHEYFGYKNTENNIRTISLKRDPYISNCFILTIRQKKRDIHPLNTYIRELPRDMNNLIYSYLVLDRCLKFSIEVPYDYPFRELSWTLLKYIENGVSKPDIYNIIPNDIYCGRDFSPAIQIESQILIYLSLMPWFHD